MVKLLDCTLRDGGYYNDWDFPTPVATELVAALNAAGVDYIELGYKANNPDGFFGLFRACDEELLAPMLCEGPSEYSFMIDAKEFLDGERALVDELRRVVRPAADSIFSMARIAAHPANVPASTELAATLTDLGYLVALNVMGFSALDDDAVVELLKPISRMPIDILYLADSFGSMRPADVVDRIRLIRTGWSGQVGLHMHENQGLALANSLAGIDEHVDYVDGTVAGMGRGAGNLRIEQLLLTLYYRYGRDDLAPSAVLGVLQDHLLPLQMEHGWGWDFSYMLSGLVGIHPTYTQELRTGSLYALDEVVSILDEIPAASRGKFNEAALADAQAGHSQQKRALAGEFVVDEPVEIDANGRDVLVIANGPSAQRHRDALRRFIETHDPVVIECNDTGVVDGLDRYTVVVNAVRMHELAAQSAPTDAARTIVTGLASVPASVKDEDLRRIDYELRPGVFDTEGVLTVPAYVVGMVALGLAIKAAPGHVYVAGFDGFTDPSRRAEHSEMEHFWELLRARAGQDGAEVVSILRTTYSLPVRSVYGLV